MIRNIFDCKVLNLLNDCLYFIKKKINKSWDFYKLLFQ